MAYIPPDISLIQRNTPESVTYVPNDGTYNDNYDPKVAQQGESPFGVELVVGTPNSNCYGLYAEPFNECANFLSILQKDERIVAYYNLIVGNLTGQNISLPFVEGVNRSIFNEAASLKPVGNKFIDSIMGHVSPNPYWIDLEGNTIGPTEDAFFDPSVDRAGWTYSGDAPSSIDSLIQNTYKETLDLIAQAINPYRIFDITGQIYEGGCREINGLPFTLQLSNGFASSIGWALAVAEYGPDAIRRNEYRGDYVRYQGQDVPTSLIEEATFYNMCLQAKECIKEYRQSYPDSYEADVAALTDDQLASLQGVQEFDAVTTKATLNQALERINLCYSYVTDRNYYNQPVVGDNGKLNQEVLYRTAISVAAIRNIIVVLLESITGVSTATTVAEYNDYVNQIQQDLQEEYERNLAEAEAKRLAKAEAMAERLLVCREADAAVGDKCRDVPNPTKTFLQDWTVRDRTSPYYAPELKKYFIVYDVVTNNFTDFQKKIDTYKLQAFNILDSTFKFNIFNSNTTQQAKEEKAMQIVRLEENGLYFEPRSFKPSKILFSVSENDLSLEPKSIEVIPRFTEQPPSSEYIRSYSMTIRDFFSSLEAFENILKKYVFDHALWKVTFGNENPSVTNLAISSSKIFNKLKFDILKQDSRNFQKFRPIFTKLLSKNGISLADDIRLSKSGQYMLDDRIMLVFAFENPSDVQAPTTVEGTSVVAPQGSKQVDPKQINTQTKPPTNNSGSGLADGLTAGTKIKMYRVQVMNGSRPPLDLIWKNLDGSGSNLEGLNSQDVFMQEVVMNYLMNLDVLLALLRPNKNDR